MCCSIFEYRLARVKMSSQPKLAVIIFVASLSLCVAHIGGGQNPLQVTDPQVYCGRNLARALALLCYDESSASKRSDSASMYGEPMMISVLKRHVYEVFKDLPCLRSRCDLLTIQDIILPYYKDQDFQFQSPSQTQWPWLSPQRAKSLSYPSRGKRYPGVVNECCDKACSIKELLTYC